jgi:iron complex outermembrane receptor protein
MVLMLVLVGMICPCLVQEAQEPPRQKDLTELTIDELMNVEITTPPRKEQKLIDTPRPSSSFLPEDIRRSGGAVDPRSPPDGPGVQVAQLDANKWAVLLPRLQRAFANKLLVLMDGRSVYDPLFSGSSGTSRTRFWRTSSGSRSSAVPAPRCGAPTPSTA